MVRLLHLADVHLGSGLSHGRLNPATGLNSRFEDFCASLARCIDHALAEAVDLVLFGGDAFPDATPPPLHQEAFARQIYRLVEAEIPVVLLVGNHDQYGLGQAGSSMAIFRTLAVPHVIVGDQLTTHRIRTRQGWVQVTTLPWLNHSALLALPELAQADDGERLQRLEIALAAEEATLDPTIPAILLAHVMVDQAQFGAERHLAVGKGFTVPLAMLVRPAYHYVALGHVHRHQIFETTPPVVYPGSIDRVDFGEEGETKGCIMAAVSPEATSVEFVPLPTRPFVTLRLDLTTTPEPTATTLAAIEAAAITDAVVRLIYTLRADQQLDLKAIQAALSAASHFRLSGTVHTPIRQTTIAIDSTPLQALERYLHHRPDLAGLETAMLAAAATLVPDTADTAQLSLLDD